MQSGRFLDFGNGKRVHLHQMGAGEEDLIALHGYGKSGAYFQPLARHSRFRVWAPDLPFHGKTEWEARSFSLFDLVDLVTAIAREARADRFVLLGHSMGGRFALALSGALLPRLNALFLLAPDGLQTGGVGWLDLLPGSVIAGLNRISRHPTPWIKLAKALQKTRLLLPAHALFVRRQLSSEAHRRRLFGCWAAVRESSLHLKVSRQLIGSSELPVGICWGDADPLLNEKAMLKWVNQISQARPLIYRGAHDPNWEEVAPFLEITVG